MVGGYGFGNAGCAIGSTTAPPTARQHREAAPLPENQTRREMLEKAILETQQRIGRLDSELLEARRFLEASKDQLAHVGKEPATVHLDSRFALRERPAPSG